MTAVSNSYDAIRLLIRHGAYAEAAAHACELPLPLQTHPHIALQHGRARMRQGRMADAEQALLAAALELGTPGERLVLQLEQAAVTIYRGAPIRSALAAAALAFTTVEYQVVDPVWRAEAERVHIRMLLQAMVYRELPVDMGQQARARLPELAAILERGGWLDEALAAHLTHAEQIPDLVQRRQALLDVAELALGKERPEVAGEALATRADLLLTTGADRVAIEADLARAALLYEQFGHRHGLLDVQRVRARLAVERDLDPPDSLVDCFDAYLAIDYPRGAISVLLDLSQLAHERGDTRLAIAYRERGLVLTDSAGMGLAGDTFVLAQVDLLIRAADFRGAIELCQAARRATQAPFFVAAYEQLESTAYALVGDAELAVRHGRDAITAYQSLGDEDSASDAALKLASDLDGLRREAAWGQVESLLREWLARDVARGDVDAAVSKHELLAQTRINQFLYAPQRQGDTQLIAEAATIIADGEALVPQLPPQVAALRAGGLAQLRGQLAQLRGDGAAVEQAWLDALAHYERGGLLLYVANCRYILGALALNRANEELLPAFGEAETHLSTALAYYRDAGMRTQAADARFMLARLYTNAAAQVAHLADDLLDAALGHLQDGETDYDAIRRDYAVGSVLDAQRGKQALAARSHRLYDLILEILVQRDLPLDVWRWAQRAKARALTDALGTSTAVPVRILDAARADPDAHALLQQERDLIRRFETAPDDQRPALRVSLETVRSSMAAQAALVDYLELRTGAAVETEDLEALLGNTPAVERAIICVDWVAVGERLLLLSWRPGAQPVVTRLPLQVSAVRVFVAEHLNPQSFRLTLRDMPELLRQLDPLVAPLAQLSDPEDLLILSPTGPLHALPLHALQLDNAPLLVRNPVVYTPSFSVLRHCLVRSVPSGDARPAAALLGDPSDDRPSAAELVARLAAELGAPAVIGSSVTRAVFVQAVKDVDLIHFQGHAVHDREDPLGSYLQLADGRLTARDLFGIAGLRPSLVTLAACESAASVIATGDEPLGLIPALLYAGASAVVATLWRVQASAAADVMAAFYASLFATDRLLDRAEALRAAMLAYREQPGRGAPYYWAPFVLYGEWRSWRQQS